MFRIEKIKNTKSARLKIIDVIGQSFVDHMIAPVKTVQFIIKEYGLYSDYDIKLLHKNKIVGFYLFDEDSSINLSIRDDEQKENLEKYLEKKGVSGIILGILPEYRNMGGGKMLIEYAKNMFSEKYDYMWGGHDKSLNNIDFWLKHRRLVGEKKLGSYVTLVDLK